MRLTALRPRTQLLLAILLPVASLILAVGLIWPYFSHLRQVRQDLERTRLTIDQTNQRIRLAEAEAEGRPLALAVVPRSQEEPILFVRQLAALSLDSHVTLTAVRALGTPRAAADDSPYGVKPTPQAPAPGAVPGQRPVLPPSSVQELQQEVTVEGSFNSVLALLVRLENFERILSVSQCRLRAASGPASSQVQAAFTLSRFVATLATAAPAAGAPTPATAAPATAAPVQAASAARAATP